jgi:hypothetical protein
MVFVWTYAELVTLPVRAPPLMGRYPGRAPPTTCNPESDNTFPLVSLNTAMFPAVELVGPVMPEDNEVHAVEPLLSSTI